MPCQCECRICRQPTWRTVTPPVDRVGDVRGVCPAEPAAAKHLFVLAAHSERGPQLHGLGHDLTRQALRRPGQLARRTHELSYLADRTEYRYVYYRFSRSHIVSRSRARATFESAA